MSLFAVAQSEQEDAPDSRGEMTGAFSRRACRSPLDHLIGQEERNLKKELQGRSGVRTPVRVDGLVARWTGRGR